MSHTYVDVRAFPHVAEPRGARLVGLLISAVAALFPAPRPAVSRRAAEAQAVREMAANLAHSDPSFSADLLAAALRHESLDDEQARR